MHRREFLSVLSGAATAALPLAARAQQAERMRSVSVLMSTAADDAQMQVRLAGFLQGLQQAGWAVGHNVRIDFRWTAGKADNIRKHVAELIALAPDVILSTGGPNMAALQQATRTIPIVFVSVADPVAAGFVDSLARPGGNITGFMNTEYGLSGKWLELLKQVAPGTTRVAVLRDLTNRSGLGQFGALQNAAPSFGVELVPVGMGDIAEIERGLGAFARAPNGGMIAPAGAAGAIFREPLPALAARHRLPAVYSDPVFAAAGGLLAYGPDRNSAYRQAASYVDRILKGEKPGDLPVQAPTKYELTINLKTAKALGLTVPPALLATADEVIE
jgi:putative ABC transport system substrate-binding protein